MSLESWAEGMLDQSFFARAVRKSTAKSVVLGWLDAMQNPNAVLSEMVGTDAAEASPPTDRVVTAAPASATPANPPPRVALPRPIPLSMPKSEPTDEPDRPGVPPRKVRKQKSQPPADGAESPPENAGPTSDPPAD